MFQKTITTTLVVLCIAFLKLSAQSIVVETVEGDSTAENLSTIQNLKFPNKNMILRKTDNSIRSFNLLSIKKLYFSQESVIPVSTVNDTEVSEITIYPNPSIDFLRIENAPVEETNLSIYSINGLEILQTAISTVNSEINVSHLQSGMYFIKINSQTLKFIKF